MARERDIDLVEDDHEDDELGELVEEEGIGSVIGFFAGMLVGAFVGASIALMLAPERGEVTRRRIRERINDLGDDARERFDDMREDAGREIRLQRKRLRRRLKGRR